MAGKRRYLRNKDICIIPPRMQNHGWIEATHPQTHPDYPCPNKHRHRLSLSESSSSQRSHPMPLDHETWARSQGFQVREVESGFRYTPDSCFDTYPFPWRSRQRAKRCELSRRPRHRRRSSRTRPPPRHLAQPAQRLRSRPQEPAPSPSSTTPRPRGSPTPHRTLDEAVFAAYGWGRPI